MEWGVKRACPNGLGVLCVMAQAHIRRAVTSHTTAGQGWCKLNVSCRHKQLRRQEHCKCAGLPSRVPQRGFVGFERRSGHAGRTPCDGIGRSGPRVSHASIRRRTRSNATITQLSQKRHALTQLFRKRNSERSGVDCGIHTDSLSHGHSCTCSDYHNTCLDTEE